MPLLTSRMAAAKPASSLSRSFIATAHRGSARLRPITVALCDLYLPGPDVGTNDADMKTIAIENGLDSVVSKPADMGGTRIDQLGAAAGGVILRCKPCWRRCRGCGAAQCTHLRVPPGRINRDHSRLGAVGAHAAHMVHQCLPGAKVIGISDAAGYLYDEEGLPVEELLRLWQEQGVVTPPYFLKQLSGRMASTKYRSSPTICCVRTPSA